MASVVIAGDTSGTVTLAAPAVAGTTTLTLPTANGTVITTGSSASLPISAISATGTPSATTYLRGDSTWATVSGGVTSLNGNTGALQGMTLLSTTSFTSASTIDITGIPTTAGTTYLLQIVANVPNNGGLDITKFSLRYSTNNGSTFATTAIMAPNNNYATNTCVSGYMGDVFWTLGPASYTGTVFANMFISNGGTNRYPVAYSASLSGDFENGENYGRFHTGPVDGSDTNNFMASGAGTVNSTTFNALRIIRRSGSQVVTGQAKLFVLGV